MRYSSFLVKVVNQIVSENKKVKEGRSLGVYVFIFIHDNISCLFLDTAWLKIIVMMKSTFVEKNLWIGLIPF